MLEGCKIGTDRHFSITPVKDHCATDKQPGVILSFSLCVFRYFCAFRAPNVKVCPKNGGSNENGFPSTENGICRIKIRYEIRNAMLQRSPKCWHPRQRHMLMQIYYHGERVLNCSLACPMNRMRILGLPDSQPMKYGSSLETFRAFRCCCFFSFIIIICGRAKSFLYFL